MLSTSIFPWMEVVDLRSVSFRISQLPNLRFVFFPVIFWFPKWSFVLL